MFCGIFSFLWGFHRYSDDRPSVDELQAHAFFKQCKRTSLAENFSLTGIDKFNCTKKAHGKMSISEDAFVKYCSFVLSD